MPDDQHPRKRAVVDRGDAVDLKNPNHDIFFAAVETTRMPMIVTDPRQADNPIIFANRAFLEMTGYAIGEIVGHNCRFLQGRTPIATPWRLSARRSRTGAMSLSKS